jgi:hypothetical protein
MIKRTNCNLREVNNQKFKFQLFYKYVISNYQLNNPTLPYYFKQNDNKKLKKKTENGGNGKLVRERE